MTNNTNYPPVHAAIYYDSYSNPVGLGSNPALVLSKMPGAQSVVGRGTIGKTIYGYAVFEAQHALLVSDCYCFG